MILIQAGMAFPFLLLFGFVIALVVFFVLIVLYNLIIKRIKKEKARTIHPFWAFIFAFLFALLIYLRWITSDGPT